MKAIINGYTIYIYQDLIITGLVSVVGPVR